MTPSGRAFWWTESLWTEAAGLEAAQIGIDSIAEFDMNCWFDADSPPTCRAVADHARRIQQADLRFPIILSTAGGLMDGGHRIAKAWLAGSTHVSAVRFAVDPEPDWIEQPTEVGSLPQ